MDNTSKKVWVCGCGEHNTEEKCQKCGDAKGERKEFAICPKCEHVHFSDTHKCQSQKG